MYFPVNRSRSPSPATRSASRGGLLLWFGAFLGAAIAVVLWMPAAWLTGLVGNATQGRLVLDDARGTVWSGSARLLLTGGEGSRDAATLPGRLEWVLRPVWLGVNLELRLPCCASEALQLAVSPQQGGAQVVVGPANLRLPMGLLSGLGTPWNTVQLQGALTLNTTGMDLQWDKGRMTPKGQLRLEAADVASRLSTLRPLGSYRMDLDAAGAGVPPSLKLDTLNGSLLLSGQGQWTDGRLHFKGEASAVPGREAALANLLNIIGRRNGLRSVITVG